MGKQLAVSIDIIGSNNLIILESILIIDRSNQFIFLAFCWLKFWMKIIRDRNGKKKKTSKYKSIPSNKKIPPLLCFAKNSKVAAALKMISKILIWSTKKDFWWFIHVHLLKNSIITILTYPLSHCFIKVNMYLYLSFLIVRASNS